MAGRYPITPLEGAPFQRADFNDVISFTEICEMLNDPAQQQTALAALGFTVDDKRLHLTFRETGKAYADPHGDRTKTEDTESSITFDLEIKLPEYLPHPLPLKIYLGGWLQDRVNFLGRIVVHDTYTIPLTGRGTAALEGRPADAHAGFCTGGACASFQERAALVLAVAVAAGATRDTLCRLGSELGTVDARYHGRRAILDYTLHCALLPAASAGPYRVFLADCLRQTGATAAEAMAPLMYGGPDAAPGDAYFAKLSQKLSPEELAGAAWTAREEAEADAAPAVEAELFPVQAREGNAIPICGADDTPTGASRSLSAFAELLQDGSRQADALRELGFSVRDGEASAVNFDFTERGRSYAQPWGDRSRVADNESEDSLCRRLDLVAPLPALRPALPIRVLLGGWVQAGVNFAGRVEVQPHGGSTFVIPLTGRGTAALEGRSKDAHAGFCTGGACACFQNRVALCMAVCRALGVTERHITGLGDSFHRINHRYHGRGDILDYTIQCALIPNIETYLDFMSRRYNSPVGRPALLHAMMTTRKPHRGYFEALAKKFSEAELAQERALWRSPSPAVAGPAQPQPQPTTTTTTTYYGGNRSSVYRQEGEPEEKKEKEEEEGAGLKCFTRVAIAVAVVAGIAIIIVYFSLRK